MVSPRLVPPLAAVSLLLIGCDTILGPDTDPAAIEISASQQTIGMVGDTVHLSAEVRNDDGDVIDDAPVTWFSRRPGVAGVDSTGLVTARANGDVWIVARSGEARDSASLTIDSPIPCPLVGDLMVPDSTDGALTTDDCDLEGWYHDIWRVERSEAGSMTIDLASTDFDTYLVLLDASGEAVGADDDGGPQANSRLFVELAAGTYYSVVTSYRDGSTGTYQLSTIEGAHPSPCPAMAALAFPDTVSGTTTTDGSCDYFGFYVDVWRLDLSDTTVVTMLAQADFNVHIAVADTFGQFVAAGGGIGSASWLEDELPAGSYDVWVGGEDRGLTGSSALSVKQGPAARTCPTEGSVVVGESVNGDLAAGDCYVSYLRSDGWELTLEDTLDLEIGLTGDPRYPGVLVTDSIGEPIRRLTGDSTLVRQRITLTPGSYRLWAQSGVDETGDYSLSVVREGQLGTCDATTTVVLDSTYEGALATTDCVTIDGRYADVYALQLDSATTATISLTSDKIDPYLAVADTLGYSIAEDDDSGAGTNAVLTLDLDAGTYHVWATSYATGEVGGYMLSLATGSASLDMQGTPSKPVRSRMPATGPNPWLRADTTAKPPTAEP